MSDTDLHAVAERWNRNPDFAFQLMGNFEDAVKQGGFSLDDSEMQKAKSMFHGGSGIKSAASLLAPSLPPGDNGQPAPWSLTPEQQRQFQDAQFKRSMNIQNEWADTMKTTLGRANRTYAVVTWMNQIMFGLGCTLIVVSVVYGMISKNLPFTLTFGGLGFGSFVAVFLVTPIDKIQNALSDLIQAEIAFTNYFEQMIFIESIASAPSPLTGRPDSANVGKASAMLQDCAERTCAMLEKYLEKSGRTAEPASSVSKPPRTEENQ